MILPDDQTFDPAVIRGSHRHDMFGFVPRSERVDGQTKYKPMDEQVVKQLFTHWVSFVSGSLVFKNSYFYNATTSDNH